MSDLNGTGARMDRLDQSLKSRNSLASSEKVGGGTYRRHLIHSTNAIIALFP